MQKVLISTGLTIIILGLATIGGSAYRTSWIGLSAGVIFASIGIAVIMLGYIGPVFAESRNRFAEKQKRFDDMQKEVDERLGSARGRFRL